MTTEQILLGIAAAAVAAWPMIKKAAMSVYQRLTAPAPVAPAAAVVAPPPAAVVVAPPPAEAVSAVVGYEAAIHDLAVVRTRLASTNLLDDKAKAAIDTLTLALVAGSDQ